MPSFEKISHHRNEMSQDVRVLRALTRMEHDADNALMRLGVSLDNVPALAEYLPLGNTPDSAAPDVPSTETESAPRVEARRSIALLRDSLTEYFQYYAASAREATLQKMRAAMPAANEETIAKNADMLMQTTCRRMADRVYADFRAVVLAEAAQYDLANDAEAYFTWRIEKSDVPLPLTMTHHDAEPRFTARNFYTPELVAQFRAWEKTSAA